MPKVRLNNITREAALAALFNRAKPQGLGMLQYDRTFDSVNAERGCFDTVACLRIEEPDGTVHAVNKFWKEVDDHFEEITKEEYDLRLESYTNKLAERGNNV